MARLADVADIIRSKNAGPYRITFDIMFKDRETYERVRQSGSINPKAIAASYGLTTDDVSSFFEVHMANAIKVTIRRPSAQGSIGESDVYGCQQHVPLMNLDISFESNDPRREGG